MPLCTANSSILPATNANHASGLWNDLRHDGTASDDRNDDDVVNEIIPVSAYNSSVSPATIATQANGLSNEFRHVGTGPVESNTFVFFRKNDSESEQPAGGKGIVDEEDDETLPSCLMPATNANHASNEHRNVGRGAASDDRNNDDVVIETSPSSASVL